MDNATLKIVSNKCLWLWTENVVKLKLVKNLCKILRNTDLKKELAPKKDLKTLFTN